MLVLAVVQVFYHLPSELGKKAAMDDVVALDEDLAEARLPAGVILQVELVKAVEDVLVGVHIEGVDVEVVRRQVQALKNLFQGQVLAVAEDHHLVGLLLQLGFYEAQQVLLMHAGRVVDVSVHLAYIVEVTVWGSLLRQKLLIRIKHAVQVELLLQQLQAMVAQRLDGPHGDDLQHLVHVREEFHRGAGRRAQQLLVCVVRPYMHHAAHHCKVML
mmetsp:Transcript_19321/g.48599  ORF Transcript_19321/g.48599 Transcript_19321/m.48599 type:complete len:215 (+) Transcript_19321:1032-1676(+)